MVKEDLQCGCLAEELCDEKLSQRGRVLLAFPLLCQFWAAVVASALGPWREINLIVVAL